MGKHAPSCATTLKKSSTAHAPTDFSESPISCKQLQLQAKKPKRSTVYTLYDPASKSFYQTFCDFTSENGFVWTLLDSFSLADKIYYNAQPLSEDYPLNQNSFKWNKFRLSLPIMNSTLSHSTHFPATCNFNNKGLLKRQDNWFQHPAAKKGWFMRKNGIYQYQRLWLL